MGLGGLMPDKFASTEVIEYSKYNLLQAKRLVWQRFSVLFIYLFCSNIDRDVKVSH